jgi:predicted component of type VI protein secretion system
LATRIRISRLTEVVGLATTARTPVIAAADPSLLGLRSLGGDSRFSDMSEIFETSAGSLGIFTRSGGVPIALLCLNRFLLRSRTAKMGSR